MKINESVQEYFELKAQTKVIEDRLAELRPVLEGHIKATTGTLTGSENAAITIEVGEYGLNLQPCARENFNFKAAASEFPDVFSQLKENKIITKTFYTMLKVTKVLKNQDVA